MPHRTNGRSHSHNRYNTVTRRAREQAIDALVLALHHTVAASLAQTWVPEQSLRELEAADDEVLAVAHALRVVLNYLAVTEPPQDGQFYPPVIAAVDSLYHGARGITLPPGGGAAYLWNQMHAAATPADPPWRRR